MPLSKTRIAFIGGGNMSRSLIAGLIADGHVPTALSVGEPVPETRARLHEQFPINVSANNADAMRGAEVVVLAVKPQVAPAVCRELAQTLPRPAPLVVSVMAGITETSLAAWLGADVPLVRSMPNTPMLVQSGAIGLHADEAVNEAQRNLAEEILRAGGLTRWVDQESELDTVTALSGSGPAYFFLLMEALESAAVAQGLNAEGARLLSIQTALGAARMAMESDESPAQLRERVTSPGGTTEAALGVLQSGGFEALVAGAVDAARSRSKELSELFGADA
jgi:pyrroline-5-carboxylate reductase